MTSNATVYKKRSNYTSRDILNFTREIIILTAENQKFEILLHHDLSMYPFLIVNQFLDYFLQILLFLMVLYAQKTNDMEDNKFK